jgi:hypothetical protein
VTDEPDEAVVEVCRQMCAEYWPVTLSSSIIVWPEPTVPSPPADQSEETAKTHELARVVVSLTDGRPEALNAAEIAPAQPVSAPV